jgi:MFS superfamily sulfate permease-like transporter
MIILSWALDFQAKGVAVLGTVPGGLPNFGLPQVTLSVSLLETLLPVAFSMFIVILAQSAATSRAYAAKAVLLFLTKPLAYMPNAVLAAVVFLIGIELVDLLGMRTILAQRPVEFWVALITAAVVVFIGVEQGILLAILLSLVAYTRHGYKSRR